VSSLQPDRLSAAQALRLAGVAARRHGIEHEVRPVRASANHVFRAGDVVVRVAPRSADVASQVEVAALRVLAPTINMIINAGRDPSYAAEARTRMRHWLGDPDAPMWTPL
jgi:hypothetical protein